MIEKRFTMSELKTLDYLRDAVNDNRKKYDPNKKVKLSEITGAFIDYTTTVDLTRSEYLLVHNVFDVVMKKLNGD